MLEHNSLPPADADAGRTETHDIYQSSASADRMADRSRPTKIGFIGLGLMGSAMAQNLAAAGYAVNAYVRRPEQLEELEARGLRATQHIDDLLGCKILISMLPDDNAVRQVFFDNGNAADALAAHFASEHQRRRRSARPLRALPFAYRSIGTGLRGWNGPRAGKSHQATGKHADSNKP